MFSLAFFLCEILSFNGSGTFVPQIQCLVVRGKACLLRESCPTATSSQNAPLADMSILLALGEAHHGVRVATIIDIIIAYNFHARGMPPIAWLLRCHIMSVELEHVFP